MLRAQVVSLLFHDVYHRDPAESGFSGPVADRYKMTVAQFEAALATLAGTIYAPVILSPGLGIDRDRALAFTFDDGGASYFTTIADRLEALGWRGHCFVTTDMIGRPGFLSRHQIRELDERGHLIGSHSATHPTRFSACSRATMLREWETSRKVLEDLLGHRVDVASLPGGYFSLDAVRSAHDAGLQVLFTSEPTPRLTKRSGCVLAGRFAIRPDHPPEVTRALAAFSPMALRREWAIWNAKKLVKPLLGAAYPRLGSWAASRSALRPKPVQGER